jgi:hypothetical protein
VWLDGHDQTMRIGDELPLEPTGYWLVVADETPPAAGTAAASVGVPEPEVVAPRPPSKYHRQ